MTGETANAADTRADDARESPGIDDSLRALNAARRETVGAALDTGRAMRSLVVADFALARSALARALVWTAVAIIFGASAWLLLMGALIALLQAMGLSWLASIALSALLSLAVTAIAAWRVTVFFEHTGMQATRRQLARFGIGDDDDDEAGNDGDKVPAP